MGNTILKKEIEIIRATLKSIQECTTNPQSKTEWKEIPGWSGTEYEKVGMEFRYDSQGRLTRIEELDCNSEGFPRGTATIIKYLEDDTIEIYWEGWHSVLIYKDDSVKYKAFDNFIECKDAELLEHILNYTRQLFLYFPRIDH